MTLNWTYPVLIACVVVIAIGQLLFKHVANAGRIEGTLLSPQMLAMLALAIGLYGVATLLWVWALQFVPLNRAYPFMALSFVLVPIGARLFFGESLTIGYGVGVLMIVAGLFVINHSLES